MPTITLETITPEVAAMLLGENIHNRHVRQSLMRRLTNAMRRGDWRLNGETIKVSESGVLLDGQHRLIAVVESNVTIESYVVRGLPDDTQQTVDIGITRSAADVLALEGYANRPKVLAATLRYLRLLKSDDFRYTGAGQSTTRRTKEGESISVATYSPQELLETLTDYPYIYDSMDATESLSRSVGGSHSQYAALHSWLSTFDSEFTGDFFERLVNGTDLTKGDPVHQLRRWLEARRMKASGAGGAKSWSRTNRLYVHALFIKAWNAQRSGRRMKTLSWKSNEPLPLPGDK